MHGLIKPSFCSTLILVLASFGVTSPVLAQNAYKCGNTYSQTPCPGGTQIDTQDGRTSGQKKASEKVTRDSEKMVNELAAERRTREGKGIAANSKAGPGVVEPPAAKPVKRTPIRLLGAKKPKSEKVEKAKKPATPRPPKPPKSAKATKVSK